MTSTVAGIHGGLDTHANRPAGNAVPDGSLYSCSTHSLIYKSNLAGNSWATYATLGSSGGAVATDVIFDAKGDLAVGTGSDTAAKLTVGTNGYVVAADSAQTTGLKYAAGQTAIAARSTRTASQTLTTATWTPVQMNVADDFDTNTIHDTVTNNSRFTVPVAGKFLCTAFVNFDASGTGDRYVQFAVNGTRVGQSNRIGGNSSIGNKLSHTDVILCAASDYIEIHAYQDSGGNLAVLNAYLAVALIGV